jgi:tRNA (adenine57-N1/adenine58-N1)-methyltransferase
MTDGAHGGEPTGAAHRRGVFRVGDRAQLTDAKGRLHTITLEAGRDFHTHRGSFAHDALIGAPEGSVVTTTGGTTYLALRPLLADFVLSMPRGAAVVYPKDSGQIVAMADVFPGARVLEAGVGSGALAMALLRAVGDQGLLSSYDRRADFADIARANVESFFGGPHPAWRLTVGEFSTAVHEREVDRVVLDLLAPWDCLDAAAGALLPGGVLICYVATATQLSRTAEAIRAQGCFTEPYAWESLVRSWHLEGLAVRPDHRMVGHTGFLITTRRIAAGVTVPARRRRPAKGAYGGTEAEAGSDDGDTPGNGDPPATPPPAAPAELGEWTARELGERPVSERRMRRLRRSLP